MSERVFADEKDDGGVYQRMKNRGKSRNKYMENMRNGIFGKGKK